jgi:CopG family nickel-responsive transcriptional regulator
VEVTTKKRFGVSIPIDIVERLNEVKELSGVDRSMLVAKALEEYLHDELHGVDEHKCSGLLILYGPPPPLSLIPSELAEIIKGVFSVKLSGGLVTIVFLEGGFRDIREVRKHIMRVRGAGKPLRFIPLYCLYRASSK